MSAWLRANEKEHSGEDDGDGGEDEEQALFGARKVGDAAEHRGNERDKHGGDADRPAPQAGAFRADNSTVTARVDLTGVANLRLGGGLTYLDLGKDLDVEKSILTFDGQYDLSRDYFVSVRYNVYNYDDFVLLDRYFTSNVVWLNVGYKLPVD